MKDRILDFLRCSACKGTFTVQDAQRVGGEITSGSLECQGCDASHDIVKFIPRFVPEENYADNFTIQWRRFRQTQLDSHSGVPISERRFFDQTAWKASDLDGALVLDVGCGAGRFAEVALACGAEVVAIDYSGAVDACWENHLLHPRIHVIQGDIYALPFRAAVFDYIYCLGVLQHTADPAGAFSCLPRLLRPEGRLAVDVYPKTGLEWLWPKYWLRPLTKRTDPSRLFRLVEAVAPALLSVSRVIGSTPGVGRKLKYLLPVANYDGVYPLTDEQLVEWAVLDTFDMLAPAYDHPQSDAVVRAWFEQADLENVEVVRVGHLVGRGSVPRGHPTR